MNNLNSIIDATTPKPIAPKSNLAALLEATKKTDGSSSDSASGNRNAGGTAPSPASTPAPAPSMTNSESLKKEIVTARVQNGWTQKELANKCGCSQGTINRAENNLRVSVYMLLKIVSVLNLKLHIN